MKIKTYTDDDAELSAEHDMSTYLSETIADLQYKITPRTMLWRDLLVQCPIERAMLFEWLRMNPGAAFEVMARAHSTSESNEFFWSLIGEQT